MKVDVLCSSVDVTLFNISHIDADTDVDEIFFIKRTSLFPIAYYFL